MSEMLVLVPQHLRPLVCSGGLKEAVTWLIGTQAHKNHHCQRLFNGAGMCWPHFALGQGILKNCCRSPSNLSILKVVSLNRALSWVRVGFRTMRKSRGQVTSWFRTCATPTTRFMALDPTNCFWQKMRMPHNSISTGPFFMLLSWQKQDSSGEGNSSLGRIWQMQLTTTTSTEYPLPVHQTEHTFGGT